MVEILRTPDGVAVTVAFLKAQFTARGETAAVASNVPKVRPPKFVKVRLLGGTRSDIVRYAPMLVFECWAPDEIAAHNLGSLAEALMNAMPDLLDGCTRVTEIGGLYDQPDPESGTPRAIFSKQIYLTSTVLV